MSSSSSADTAGKPIKCKACVMWNTDDKNGGADFSIEEVTVAPPKAGEVRLKILTTAVCHTDIYNKSGKDSETCLPAILGHEALGVVESVGEGVTGIAVGDTCIPLYTPECGDCKFCRATGDKRTNLCARIRATQGKGLMPDGTTRFTVTDKDGKEVPVFHFMGVSSFCEYTVVAAISVAKVPTGIDAERACLFGCGLTTGYGAVVNNAHFEKGSTAAVFGLGAVGLAVVLGLREAGASRVIVVDTNPAKFDKAREIFPAVECVNPLDDAHKGKKIEEVIIAMTTNEGFGGVDYSFECIGRTDTMRSALEATHRAWGKSVIIGVAEAGKEIATRPFMLVTGRHWTGSAFGGVKGKSELPAIVDKLLPQAGIFVTHRYSGVEAINAAVHDMHNPASGCIRPVITL